MKNLMNLPMLLTKSNMPFADRASEALTMVVMGMVMVFLVLATIMLVLLIMERVFTKGSKKAKPVAEAPKKTEPVPAPVVQTQDDGAVIAAITAAISAILAAENGTETYEGGFRVVSFKRSTRKSTWNSAK